MNQDELKKEETTHRTDLVCCHLCGHKEIICSFERYQTINTRVFGHLVTTTLFRCRDREACEARVRDRNEAT